MTYDGADSEVVLFGGYSSANIPLQDTWVFKAGNWTDLTKNLTRAPAARSESAMTYDAADGYVLLFGGCSSLCPEGDTWDWANDTWTRLGASKSPPGSQDAMMVYDAVDGYVVLYGGADGLGNPLNDTWTYAAGKWTNVTNLSDLPPARFSGGIASDSKAGYLVMFGGCLTASCSTAVNETWAFENGTWLDVAPYAKVAPPRLGRIAMTYDPIDGYVLEFGGVLYGGTARTGSTWDYQWDTVSVGSLSVTPNPDDAGLAMTVHSEAVGGTFRFNYSFSGLPAGCISRSPPPFTCTPTASGIYNVVVNVTDTRGAWATLNATLHVNPTPAVVLSAPRANVDKGEAFNFTALPTGGASPYVYSYQGLPTGCSSANMPSIHCVPTATGNFTATVRVTDKLGVVNTSAPVAIAVYTTVTSGSAVSPSATDVGIPASFIATGGGGVKPYTFVWSGLPPGCDSSNLSVLPCVPTLSGAYSVTVAVTDVNGQTVNSSATNLVVNDLPQASAMVSPTTGTQLPFEVSANAEVYFGTGPFDYSWSWGDSTFSNGSSSTHVYTAAGNFTVSLRIVDAVGYPAWSNLSVLVDSPMGATVSASVPLGIATVGAAFTLNVVASGGRPPYTYSWRGLPAGCSGAAAATIDCSPTSPGATSPRATISDTFGEEVNASIAIRVNAAVVATAFGFAPTPACGLPFEANFTSTVGGGTAPFVLQWSFGDGGVASTAHPSHTYTAPGAYDVKFTVTDSVGAAATVNVSLTVSAPTNCGDSNRAPGPGGGGGSNSSSGGSPISMTVLLAIIVVITAAAIALALLMRRRPPEGSSGVEESSAEESTDEAPDDEGSTPGDDVYGGEFKQSSPEGDHNGPPI